MLPLEEMKTVEDAVALGLAADEFLLESLRSFCASEIKRLVTVENVWSTLNSAVLIPALADACSEVNYSNLISHSYIYFILALLSTFLQVLSNETGKCLDHKTFLEASKESLLFLLQMETLNIKSETELFLACKKLANSL